jgi:hypothetical protein
VAAAPEAAQPSAEMLSPAAKAVADTARADKAEAAIAGARGSGGVKAAAAPGAGQLAANAAAEVKSENIAKELKSENSAAAGSGSGGGGSGTSSGPGADSSQHAKPRLHGGIHGRTRSRAGGADSSSSTASAVAHGGQDSTASGGSSGRRLHGAELLGGSGGSRQLEAAAAPLAAAQRIRRSRQLQQLRQQAAARQHALVPVTGAIADVAHSLRHHNIEAAEHVQAAHELAAFLTRAHAAVQMHLFQAYGACGLHLALEGQLAAASGMLRGWAQRTAAATQGATQQPKPQLVWPGARPPLDLRIILSAHVHGAHLMNEGKP